MSIITKVASISAKVLATKEKIEKSINKPINDAVKAINKFDKIVRNAEKHSQRYVNKEYAKLKKFVEDKKKFVDKFVENQQKKVDKWIKKQIKEIIKQYKLEIAEQQLSAQEAATKVSIPLPGRNDLKQEIAAGIPDPPISYPKMPKITIPWPKIPWPDLTIPFQLVPTPGALLAEAQSVAKSATDNAKKIAKDAMSESLKGISNSLGNLISGKK